MTSLDDSVGVGGSGITIGSGGGTAGVGGRLFVGADECLEVSTADRLYGIHFEFGASICRHGKVIATLQQYNASYAKVAAPERGKTNTVGQGGMMQITDDGLTFVLNTMDTENRIFVGAVTGP